MIHIEENKLLIEVQHPCPEDFANDLTEAIIAVMQRREITNVTNLEQFQQTNYTLLELLKNIRGV